MREEASDLLHVSESMAWDRDMVLLCADILTDSWIRGAKFYA